ncbi:hypothetical protein AGMMS49960_05550 [Betaproteobacteria bacterium]|nr:hypothetical protein AGMMS49543_25130 [Betaproteobacteria bacterium]GHT99667.1 hypothetical protein AGMMS49960_05550 [Betaproteobacteria bacterium]GHU14889.1 hypothetical protein AGMMS50225_27630 [Betaproteobacteria bacterium]GHU22930.1 hypothetical protein AGMMS50243_23440 [Betaproteobacteria bacterium]
MSSGTVQDLTLTSNFAFGLDGGSIVLVLVDLNYGEVAAYPVYCLRVEEPEDQRALVEIVEKGVAMG